MKHKTEIDYSAGVRTYKLRCEVCGELPGISLTLKDAEKKGADHRREMRNSTQGKEIMPKKTKKAESYPMHFVGFEGKQGTDDFRAVFSTEAPEKVETPFGTEADVRKPKLPLFDSGDASLSEEAHALFGGGELK